MHNTESSPLIDTFAQHAVSLLKKLSGIVNAKLGLRCFIVVLGVFLLVLAHLSGQVIKTLK